MLWYIALIATLNLGVGYVLGVYLGVLPWGRGAASQEFPKVSLGEPPLRPEMPTRQPTPATAPSANPTPSETPEASNASPDDLTQGLTVFQEQLAAMGAALRDSVDDADSFDDCAARMQEANHDYLESAHKQIDQFGDSGAQSSAGQAFVEGTRSVEKISGEFDTILAEEGRDEQTRKRLLDKSDSLVETVSEVEQRLGRQDLETPTPEEAPVDPLTGLSTLDYVLASLSAELARPDETTVVTVVQTDLLQDEGGTTSGDLEQRIQMRIADVVSDFIPPTQLAASQGEGRFLLVTPGVPVEEACRDADRLRQQVEKTRFLNQEQELASTVTCAVAEGVTGMSFDALSELLDEALSESKRLGGNRTYHHDGAFPAPVAPEEFQASERTLEL